MAQAPKTFYLTNKELLKAIHDINIFDHNLEFKKISILFKKIENDN